MDELLEQASKVHAEHHDNTLKFERSIFINWSCALADCTYCYLSTQPKSNTFAKRDDASILAEVLLCKHFGWHVDYVTGGIGVHTLDEQKTLMNRIHTVLGHPVAINLGPMSKKHFDVLLPDIAGVGVAIESFLPEIQKKVCPSKPHAPFLKTISLAHEFGLRNVITIILGLGETKEDWPLLEKMIKENGIQKIQFCFLKPQKGTVHEYQESPTSEYAAWWIATARIAFPTLTLKIALTEDRIGDLPLLCKAGINTFSRFAVIKRFNSPIAHMLEDTIKATGRSFDGNFTKMIDVDWDGEIDNFGVGGDLKVRIKAAIHRYLRSMTSETYLKQVPIS